MYGGGGVIQQLVWLYVECSLIHWAVGEAVGSYGFVKMVPCKKEELGQS